MIKKESAIWRFLQSLEIRLTLAAAYPRFDQGYLGFSGEEYK